MVVRRHAARARPGVPTAALGNDPPGAAPRGDDGRSTRLDFQLELRDAGQLLDRMRVHDTVDGAAGTLSGNVRWRGSLGIDYPTLDGEVALELGKGAFLKVGPGGGGA